MPEIAVERLLSTPSITISNVRCAGGCKHESEAECASSTHIVFPYRGAYVRHVGQSLSVADANQVLFFNSGQEYRVSHPVEGGDDCLSLFVADEVLHELVPAAMLQPGGAARFLQQHRRIDAGVQLRLAQLLRALRVGGDPLEAETRAMALLRGAVGGAASTSPSHAKRKLAERIKLLLAGDPARRWTLAEIAEQVGGSPVYLTQAFQQAEGMPLYRYQLQLRLARALALMDGYDDLSALSFDLGFSSHSHFSASFRQLYGCAPSALRAS